MKIWVVPSGHRRRARGEGDLVGRRMGRGSIVVGNRFSVKKEEGILEGR